MDLSLTESQEMLRKVAREFREQAAPRRVLLTLDGTETGISPELWSTMADMGWLGMLVPERYGGGEASLLDAATVYEELGYGPVGGPHFTSAVLGTRIVLEAGREAQRGVLLPNVARGQTVLALAQTEADYGWGPESVKLAARKDGTAYRLDGTKLFVHDGAAATHLLVVARTRQATDPRAGISIFVVDRKTPGIHVRNVPGFVGPVAEVRFEDVRVPASAVLGEPDVAWAPLQRAIINAVPVLCAYQVGSCQAVFDMTMDYTRRRVQFGQPIGRFQRVQDHVIDIVNALDAARWTTYEAIWKLDSGKPDAVASAHLAKVVASESLYKAANAAHEAHAGIAVVREYGMLAFTRESRTLYHYLGDPQYHKRRLAEALEL